MICLLELHRYSQVLVWKARSRISLTALRAIEHDPNREVGREIFKSMRLTGGHEQKGAWFDPVSLFAIEEDPLPRATR